MLIPVTCKHCGRTFRVGEGLAGDTVNCTGCSKLVLVTPPGEKATLSRPKLARPTLPLPPTYDTAGNDEPTAAPPDPAVAGPRPSLRDYVYWSLALAIFPLAIVLGQPDPEPLREQVQKTLRHVHPAERERAERIIDGYEDGDLDDIFAMMPDQRLEGADYRRDTSIHWLFALATVLLFAFLLGISFPHGSVPVLHLVGIGLFTGTVGVGILLFIHMTPIGLFIAVLEFSSETDKTNFWAALVFFTLGVGLVEEGCKAIALLIYMKGRPEIGWRQACLCGLATGVGFGVSEAIMYSSEFYNGIETNMTYLVRFASCVTLHAIWSASAAVTLYHSQDLFHFMQAEGAQEQLLTGQSLTDELMGKFASVLARYGVVVLRMIAVVMFLHGLFDATLTLDMKLAALLTALASFGYLAWQIEECRRMEFASQAPVEPEAV